jgi:hypothetical protein
VKEVTLGEDREIGEDGEFGRDMIGPEERDSGHARTCKVFKKRHVGIDQVGHLEFAPYEHCEVRKQGKRCFRVSARAAITLCWTVADTREQGPRNECVVSIRGMHNKRLAHMRRGKTFMIGSRLSRCIQRASTVGALRARQVRGAVPFFTLGATYKIENEGEEFRAKESAMAGRLG